MSINVNNYQLSIKEGCISTRDVYYDDFEYIVSRVSSKSSTFHYVGNILYIYIRFRSM